MTTLFSELPPELRFRESIADRQRLESSLATLTVRYFASSTTYRATGGSKIETEFCGQPINPILRPSFDLHHHTTINYIVRMSDHVAEGRIPPKGIILEAYGAKNGQREAPDLDTLAREGYVVVFMNGHDLEAQSEAGGARSTLRDIYYMAKLITDSRLKDFAGNSPLTTLMRYNHDLPLIFKGFSQGGFLALNLATNQEILDFHFTVSGLIPQGMQYNGVAAHGLTKVISMQGRYHEPFDAFISEAPWFPTQEMALAISDPRHTNSSRSRVVDGAANRGWQLAVQPRARGMIQSESEPGVGLDVMQNLDYLNRPLLLISSRQDQNTPVELLYDFAAAAVTRCINQPHRGAFVAQYYYRTGSGDLADSHNIPVRISYNRDYFQIKNRFIERVKLHKSGWRATMNHNDLDLIRVARSWSSRPDLLSACLRYEQPYAVTRTEYRTDMMINAAEVECATETQRAAEMIRAAEAVRAAETQRAVEMIRAAEAVRAAETQQAVERMRATQIEPAAEIQRAAEMNRLAQTERVAELQQVVEITRAAQLEHTAARQAVCAIRANKIAQARAILEKIDTNLFDNQCLASYRDENELILLCHKITDIYNSNLQWRNMGIICMASGAIAVIGVVAINGMAISLLLIPGLNIFAIMGIGIGIGAIGATLTTVSHLRNSHMISGQTIVDFVDDDYSQHLRFAT